MSDAQPVGENKGMSDRPMRQGTSIHLDQRDYEDVLKFAGHPRERMLLDWLRNDSADSVDLLDWLNGEFVILPQEGPSMAILQSLPALDNPLEPAVRNVLTKRLAEAVDWLASNSEERPLWATGTWVELFILIRRLGDVLLSEPLTKLRRAFDSESPPFTRDHECARMFTKLVMNHQLDNELKDRWATLVRGEQDLVLKASLFDALRGLLAMPDMVSYATFECCLAHFCKRVNDAIQCDEEKRQKAEELRTLVKANYLRFAQMTQLALARLWNDYEWLPVPHPLLFAIATIRDMAVMVHLARGLKRTDHPCAQSATLMHDILFNNSSLSLDLKEYIRRNRGRLSQTPMKSGVTYNWRSFNEWKKVSEDDLADPHLEAYIAQCEEIGAPNMKIRLGELDDFYRDFWVIPRKSSESQEYILSRFVR